MLSARPLTCNLPLNPTVRPEWHPTEPPSLQPSVHCCLSLRASSGLLLQKSPQDAVDWHDLGLNADEAFCWTHFLQDGVFDSQGATGRPDSTFGEIAAATASPGAGESSKLTSVNSSDGDTPSRVYLEGQLPIITGNFLLISYTLGSSSPLLWVTRLSR